MNPIFLDVQSGTPVLPEALEAMQPWLSAQFGNPSSLHQWGLRARAALDQARQEFARLVHAESPQTILFTSSGTEASNLAVKGAALAAKRHGNHIVLSQIEHPAVTASVEFLNELGFAATRVPVDRQGFVDPETVARAITPETILICTHLANYDIGTVQPVRELAGLAQNRGIPLFVDATYCGGWIPVDVQEMGIDLLSLAPHRFYGPKGIGVLYRRRGTPLSSLIHGGSQEEGLRAGTENVAGIAGAGAAARIARNDLAGRNAHASKLQARLWSELNGRVPHLHLNGPLPGPSRVPTSLNVSVEFLEGEGLLLALDMKGIAVASGSSCVSKAVRISPVLQAIGLDHARALGSILLSVGKDNTEEELLRFIELFPQVVERLRSFSPLWEPSQPKVIFPAGAVPAHVPPSPN